MEKAVIGYQGGELEAWEHADRWTVRFGELEATARYLDLALSTLLGEAESVHQLAAQLVAELTSAPQATEDVAPVAA